jgi:hypothetical protein
MLVLVKMRCRPLLDMSENMTIQVQNTLRRLVAHHGYSATFVQHMGEGICMYSIGGIMYRIRGDGTIL